MHRKSRGMPGPQRDSEIPLGKKRPRAEEVVPRNTWMLPAWKCLREATVTRIAVAGLGCVVSPDTAAWLLLSMTRTPLRTQGAGARERLHPRGEPGAVGGVFSMVPNDGFRRPAQVLTSFHWGDDQYKNHHAFTQCILGFKTSYVLFSPSFNYENVK